MHNFTEYLSGFHNFTNQEIQTIESVLVTKSYKANEYFFEAGNYANEIGFVENGVFRIFFYDKEGNEIVRHFVYENQFIVDLYAFTNKVIGSIYIQAITSCKITILNQKALNELTNNIPNWGTTFQNITQKNLLDKIENQTQLMSKDATTKYLDFLKTHPTLANRIPLGHLASYLGIKQPSLSRIRKNLSSHNTF